MSEGDSLPYRGIMQANSARNNFIPLRVHERLLLISEMDVLRDTVHDPCRHLLRKCFTNLSLLVPAGTT
jgi:hypothetical protein